LLLSGAAVARIASNPWKLNGPGQLRDLPTLRLIEV
jgi:hypothetical protein